MRFPESLKVPFPTNPVYAMPPTSAPARWEPERIPPPEPVLETGGEDIERPCATDCPPPADEPTSSPPKSLSLDSLDQLMALASQGDAEAISAVQNFLADGGSAEWRMVGDLAQMAERMLAAKLFPQKASYRLSLDRRYQDLRDQLADEDASPLEKLAIDRVIAASMFAHALDLLAANGGAAGLTSVKLVKAQETAEKRCQAALRTLQLAREISRGAAGRPLKVFGAKEAVQQTQKTKHVGVA